MEDDIGDRNRFLCDWKTPRCKEPLIGVRRESNYKNERKDRSLGVEVEVEGESLLLR